MNKGKLVITISILLLLTFLLTFFPPFLESGDVSDVPQFREIPVGFTHQHNGMRHPFLGATITDINNDGSLELFVGGGKDQEDVMYTFQEGKFQEINSSLSDLEATHGVLSVDLDNNGYVDFIIARTNGVFIYYNDKGTFTKEKIPLDLQNSVPLSVAAGDFNNDGYVDFYVSTFIKASLFKPSTYNDPNHRTKNFLLKNNGDNTFTDVTKKAGVVVNQNTFLAVFVDLNNDGKQDLVVAPNTDQVKIFENLGGEKFKKIPSPTGFGGWMGLSVSDYDNDGDSDLFFSNMGNFLPHSLLKGDLHDDQNLETDWALLTNEGNFTFTKKSFDLEFAWGSVFEDFNLDGYTDLFVLENYFKWVGHKISPTPGRFFIQKNGEFLTATAQAGLENLYFGQSPLTADFNNDGALDIVIINMIGPVRAFLNQVGKESIKVILPENVTYLGAKVTVGSQTKQFVPGTGFLTDSSPEMIFASDNVQRVVVKLLNGEEKVFEDVRGTLVVS